MQIMLQRSRRPTKQRVCRDESKLSGCRGSSRGETAPLLFPVARVKCMPWSRRQPQRYMFNILLTPHTSQRLVVSCKVHHPAPRKWYSRTSLRDRIVDPGADAIPTHRGAPCAWHRKSSGWWHQAIQCQIVHRVQRQTPKLSSALVAGL